MAPPPARESEKPHVMIFPYVTQGHTIPLIHFSEALSSRGLRLTVVATPFNAPLIRSRLSGGDNITLAELSFSSELPSIDHPFDFLLAAEVQLRSPFEALLRRMGDSNDLPRFVVSDFFLGFTLSVCTAFDVPRLVFHGMGVLSMSVCKAYWIHKPHLVADSDTIDLPGLNLPYTLTISDLSNEVVNSSDKANPVTRFYEEVVEAELNSWGVLVNSFVELDAGSVPFFESFYYNGARAWCVGPLCLYDDDHESRPSNDDDDRVMRWLDERRVGSVLYVSFGSQSDVSNAQLNELARGLVESGESFVWVVRSRTWTVPSDIKEKVNNKGLVVSGWVNQRKILGHASVGGFLSHCGWNSVLESLSAGVPVLAWPMFAEQGLNAKLVVEGLGAGIRVSKKSNNDGLVSRVAISKGVRELMSGEKGRAAKERARALGYSAKRAIGVGGSSRRTLDELVQKLCGI